MRKPPCSWKSTPERLREDERKAAKAVVAGVAAGGGTVPDGAMQMVFSMKPRPDAIYFMTDGQFGPQVASLIHRLNRRGNKRVPVHSITFGDQGAARLMQQIADESGGTYTHIGVTHK